jgi:hypothetical protein
MLFLVGAILACVVGPATMAAGQASTSGPTPTPKTGVIVGRVLDPSGQPVSGVLVTLLQRRDSRGVTRVHPVDIRLGSITNASGEFRLDQLAAGSYYVVAIPRPIPRNQAIAADNEAYRFGYAITYYPGVERVSEARSVTVSASAATTAEIRLASAHLAEVSGTAIGADGHPARGGTMLVAHGDGLFGIDSVGVPIRPDGTFLVKGLPPGTYFLQLREGKWPPPRDVIPKVSGATVRVYDGDVKHVRAMPIEMVKVTGRLIVDPTQRSLRPSEIRISGAPTDWNGNPGPQRAGTLRDDFTFEFRTWPSKGYIRVWVGSQEWTTKTVRLKGVDLAGKDIDFSGPEISGVEVELGGPWKR